MVYKIYDIIGENCMTPDEGQKVYDLIHPQLVADNPVELDFIGVNICISPFFNFAIGQLLKDVDADTLNRLLKVSNLNPVGKQVLKVVIDNAKRYYSDDNVRQAVDRLMSERASYA
ncbi:MAG: STAS-like domain-containing protein [Crocosphaera sp.]|nr:STAS-like domain-containing protein [Crocosphaera sp.]